MFATCAFSTTSPCYLGMEARRRVGSRCRARHSGGKGRDRWEAGRRWRKAGGRDRLEVQWRWRKAGNRAWARWRCRLWALRCRGERRGGVAECGHDAMDQKRPSVGSLLENGSVRVLEMIRLLGYWASVAAWEQEHPNHRTPLAQHFRTSIPFPC
jgi:hypothetical protein